MKYENEQGTAWSLQSAEDHMFRATGQLSDDKSDGTFGENGLFLSLRGLEDLQVFIYVTVNSARVQRCTAT